MRDVKGHSIESDLWQEEIPVIAIGLDHAIQLLSSLSGVVRVTKQEKITPK